MVASPPAKTRKSPRGRKTVSAIGSLDGSLNRRPTVTELERVTPPVIVRVAVTAGSPSRRVSRDTTSSHVAVPGLAVTLDAGPDPAAFFARTSKVYVVSGSRPPTWTLVAPPSPGTSIQPPLPPTRAVGVARSAIQLVPPSGDTRNS